MSFTTRLLKDVTADAQITDGFSLAALNRLDPKRYPALLSSSSHSPDNAQYDIAFAFPQYRLTLDAHAQVKLHVFEGALPGAVTAKGFLAQLDVLLRQESISAMASSAHGSQLPFTGGWLVYLAYEMAAEIEPRLKLPDVSATQPQAVALRCPAAIIHDKHAGRYIALAESGHEDLLDTMTEDFHSCQQAEPVKSSKISLQALAEAATEPYLRQVARIKQYIIDGDIFQANLSRPWKARLAQSVADATLFSTLAQHNPASFAALAVFDEMSIISSSPERLVSIRDGLVQTRPIAGTRPRSSDRHDDQALADELMSHPKEQAEHIMLIDLERNDLGRVCQPGTIEVDELMVLESWEHVHHIVSNIRGRLQQDRSPVDVIRAVFPGGTITGCPKVRCMEILAELEQQPRGAYTGSLGYINRDGSMDLNILIRTMVREGDQITFRAGGGIVSDSVAENELDETRAKAKGLLRMFDLIDATGQGAKMQDV